MPGERWRPREWGLFRRWYGTRGAHYVRERLLQEGFDRSVNAIHAKARHAGIPRDPTRRGKLVVLADAHAWEKDGSPRSHPRIVQAAREAGVLERGATWPHPHLAPAEWVDAYIRDLGEEEQRVREIEGTWLTTEQAAKAFGVRADTLASMTTPSRLRGTKRSMLGEYARSIPTKQVRVWRGATTTMARFWHPSITKRQAKRYREYREESAWHRARNGAPSPGEE